MLRILHIVTNMDRGGLETMLMNYYRHIDRDKIQFDFLVHREARAAYDDEIESLGGKIYRISRLIPWSKNYRNTLKDFFKSHPEYKIVHVHQDCLSSVALKCARECGVPHRIAHSHSSSQDKNLKYPIKLYYKRKISRYATDLFACSDEAGRWMFCGADFRVVNNAIDAKKYVFNLNIRRKVRDSLILTDEFVVGLVGRFSPAKNHAFLLDIFAEVVRLHNNSKLLLVGDGELRSEIEEKVRALGLTDKVIFTGVREDVPALLQAMDIFVFPSLYEGLGIVAIEAQTAGLPLFISDKVPIECQKTDLVWQLSLSDSPETWASAILNGRNTERTDRFFEIAAAGFDIAENAEWLQNYYLSLVE